MTFILNQIDLGKLFQTQRIFEVNPDESGLYLYLAIIFGIFIIAAIIIRLIIRAKKPKFHQNLLNKFFSLFLTAGLIGLVLIFFRYQGVSYLGSRLMMLILLAGMVVWLGLILYYWLIILPQEIKVRLEKEKFEKYLPRRPARVNIERK